MALYCRLAKHTGLFNINTISRNWKEAEIISKSLIIIFCFVYDVIKVLMKINSPSKLMTCQKHCPLVELLAKYNVTSRCMFCLSTGQRVCIVQRPSTHQFFLDINILNAYCIKKRRCHTNKGHGILIMNDLYTSKDKYPKLSLFGNWLFNLKSAKILPVYFQGNLCIEPSLPRG